MVRYPNSQEPSECPFAVAFGKSASEGFFKYLADNKVPQASFFGTMKGIGMAPGVSHHRIANGYAWNKLESATVVDVSCLLTTICAMCFSLIPELSGLGSWNAIIHVTD